MREVMSLRLTWLWASVTVVCVGAFVPLSPPNGQCHQRNNEQTALNAEDWSKFMSVSDGASQNTGASDPFERMKKRPPRSMGGNTGMNYQASYPEAPNSDTYGPPSDYDYGQQNDASSPWRSQSQAASSSLGASASSPYPERSSSNSMPNEDQTSPVWSSFMTVADGPEPIPDPVTRKREEEMARKREEERQWQQQQQQQQQYGQQQFQQPPPQQYQQQYPNGGMPPPPYQSQMSPYGPPFAPFPMQQPPYNNMPGSPYYPPGSTPFPASPFGATGGDGTATQNSAGGYDEQGQPNPGDPFQEQTEDDRIQDENERARAVVQERMAKEMAKFESENGPSSEKSPSAWWEAIQAKQDAKDKTSGGSSSSTAAKTSSPKEFEEESSTGKSPSWASTLPQPSASSTGFNNPWRPNSETQDMESSATLPPPPPPPPGPILGPPDMNNAWTPDSDQAPDKAPGYWSQFMAVSDGTADTPKTYEEQKAEWERQQRAMQREQEELARQQEAARDPAVAARLETDLLRVQVEQQQAQERARWEEERLVELEAEIHEREVEQKRAHMSVDNESPRVEETEQEKAKKRLEQAELMAKKLVEQEVERAAAVTRYRDLRNQVEAERQFREEEEAREHARSKAEKGLGDDVDVDAIDVDAEEQDISDSINTLETLMKALEETKRQIEEEKKKAKYNEKAKASAAAEEWEAAVARARAKIMAEEIISTKTEEPKAKDDGDDKAYARSEVDSKSRFDSVKKVPTAETLLNEAASSEGDAMSSEKSDEKRLEKSEEVNTVVLNGITIVTDSSTPEDTSDADSQDNTGPKATVDGITMTSESSDNGPFKFFESAKAMENGKTDSSSARSKTDNTTTPSDSKRQYFANRIEETRKRAMIESEKRRAGKVQAAKAESTVTPVAVEEDAETDTRAEDDAKEVQGEASNFEYFANRIAESRKRALLSSIESATSSSDSSIFVRTKMDGTKTEAANKDTEASSQPSTSKTFTPNRLEEREKLALLATLLQELPELIKDADDANPEVQKATRGLQDVILKNPFIKRNGKSAADTPKNGAQKIDSSVTIETPEASVASSKGPKKKNGSRKSQGGRTKSDSKVSSEADFEDVKKIFEETASRLGTTNGKAKANGSSPSLIRTIGKSTNGKNETGVDSPKVEADNSSN